jgi:ABC-2 type transport system ATP-binding protein
VTIFDITINNLRKTYGDTVAVDGLSQNIDKGALFGLIGPDGAGKTTTLRILCGLLHADSGDCSVAGRDVIRKRQQVRSLLGYMPQRFSLYPDLTVAENLHFFADLFRVSKSERLQRTERLLEFSRLTPFLHRRAAQLSGGMKQKLALSCTLIHTPSVLLLDEPTTGVDPVSRREFWEILHELKSGGVTILVTTPYMDEAAKCDRIAFIHKGKILIEEAPERIPGLYPNIMVEVVADQPFAAANALTADGRFASVQLFGDRLHLGSSSAWRQCENDVKLVLSQHSIELLSIKAIQPTIEDVFVELLK